MRRLRETVQSKALYFEQKAGGEDKSTWNGILVYAEQERGKVHPVVFELIGEARKLAKKVGYKVYAVMVGTARTAENAKELLLYGVDEVFVYEHEASPDLRQTVTRMLWLTASPNCARRLC